MLLFAYDYKDDKVEFTVNEDFDYLKVSVISGDEIVEVWKNGGPGEVPKCITYCDAGKYRLQDCTDTEYYVSRTEIEDWLKRTDSYAW